MLKRNLFGFLFCLFATAAIAQDSYDTTVLLHEISINSYRFEHFSEGSKQQKIDSSSKANYMASSVADALNSLSTLVLKSYGISGNTSISLRGTSAAHTAILWNGINLQNPLNGGSNLELIPMQAIEEIVVQYGGSGALYGSGAIGGAILMQSKIPFESKLKTSVNAGIGSFSNYFAQASIQKGSKKLAGSFGIFYRQAENDFPFKNFQQYGHPETRQSNAAAEYFGINQDSRFLLTDNQQINTHLWIQKSTRQLPPNMTTLQSKQVQTDEAFRFSADYTLAKVKTDWMTRFGLLSSKLNYNDSLNGIFAEHRSKSAILESEVNYKFRLNHLINFGIHNRLDWGQSDSFEQINQRNNLAFLLSYKYWNPTKTMTLTASIRQELSAKKWSQPNPGLGINFKPFKHIQFSGKISRNYRQPTFNDLFWIDGYARGNPDLLAESAWAEDLAASFSKNNNQNKVSLSLSFFNTYVKNLILWVPIEGIWTPMNQKEVWSRGLETDLRFEKEMNHFKIKLELHHTYNLSSIEKKADNESESILHKQLIYTPKNQVKALFSIQHRLTSFFIEQLFVSKSFTMADNSSWLGAYHITNLHISHSFKKKKQNFGISFRLNNLFNQDYQSMQNYALPGRNYQFSIHHNIN